MSLADDLISGLTELETELGQTCSISGVDYPCIRRLTRKGNDPTEGGTWLTAVGSLTIRRALFTTMPKEGAAVTVSGENYTILGVGDDAQIPFVQIQYGKVPKS